MNKETLMRMNVGDVIEVDGLFEAMSKEKMLLIAVWAVKSNGGKNKTIEFSMKYFGVYLGKAVCRIICDEVTWVMGASK